MDIYPSFSIIVNTWNRGHLLKHTLESFRWIKYKGQFEVIVVNGPSTDCTCDVIRDWSHAIRTANCDVPNLSVSRNIGICMAKGEIIAFIDDDAIPQPEWLEELALGYSDTNAAAVGGKVYDHTGYNWQYQYATLNRLGQGSWQRTKESPNNCFPYSYDFPYLQGTNTSFRKDILLKVGGFDEEFEYYMDEAELCLRIIDKGYFINQLPNACVYHKYASSNIRENGVAKFRYPVLKNKIYFSYRYALDYMKESCIIEDNTKFEKQHRDDILRNISNGKLFPSDLDEFEKQVKKAWVNGVAAAKLPQKLINNKHEKYCIGEFKVFETINPNDQTLIIALLCEDYPPNLLGGIARFTQDKATALAALGHIVHVIARSHTHSTVDFEDGVWVHRILVNQCPLSIDAATLNVPQYHWDQSKSFLDELDRISIQHHIDIVEAPIWNIVGIAPLLSGRYKTVTSLMTTLKLALPSRPDLTSDEDHFNKFVKPIINIEEYMVTHSHGILAISESIRYEIENAYHIEIPKNRLHISHLGMPDWSRMVMPSTTDKEGVKFTLLFVGRLEKRKGIDMLLKISPRLCKEYPHLEIVIVGDDSIVIEQNKTYRELFEQEHDDLWMKQIHFRGKCSDTILRQLYSECDLFVAPSRFESFGLIFVEAMMFSKPVIGCHAGGMPEVVSHNDTGILVAPGDHEQLYDGICLFIGNSKFRIAAGLAGRKRYLEKFTDRKMAEESVNIYKNI